MLRHSLLATAALTIAATPGLAQSVDGEAFVARLQAAVAEGGGSMSHGAVSTEGDTVTVDGVTFGTGEATVDVGTTHFVGVSGSDAEGWQAASGSVDDFERTEGAYTTSASGLTFENLTIQPEGTAAGGETDAPSTNFWIERMAMASLAVSEGEEERFSLTDLSAGGELSGGEPNEFELAVGSFTIVPPTSPKGENAVRALGYEQLTGDMNAKGLWNRETGELALSPLTINVADAGSMVFAYSISGYTPAFMQQLAALQAQMAANPEGENGASLALLGLMSQLTVNSVELRFEDDSLTDRLLDRYAEQNDVTREQMIDQLIGTLPALLAALNNPKFQTQVTEAVDAFLRDPQSITAAIAPAQPIPATQIMGAAMGAPQTLPAVLGLTVRSND